MRLMCRSMVVVLALAFAGCAGSSYGMSTDGTFPPRPAGVDYPNWEHLCLPFDQKNATEILNSSGDKGWELVAVGMQGADNLMCFKRLKSGQ